MMKSTARRSFVKKLIVTVTALFLVGTVPSFAYLSPCSQGWDTAARMPIESVYAEDEDTPQRSDIQIMPAVKVDPDQVPKLNGTSALIMDMGSGSILYEKEADKVREPASLTKIITCLIILEEMDMDEVVTIREGIETIGSIVGLIPGEKITVEQLLYGMMLVSGNDAAEALAFACDGNLADFSDRMNERAADCGATSTEFRNPNGLDEVKTKMNYTTARDMALITAEAMENEMFREIVSTAKYTIPATNKSEKRELRNTNYCLWDKETKVKIGGKEVPLKYKGCVGVKTGFTDGAGYCFIGDAKRDGNEFMVVCLNTDDDYERFKDAIKLWNYAFDTFGTYKVLSAGEKAGVQRVVRGSVRKVDVSTRGDLTVTINRDDMKDPGITTEFLLDNEKIKAPVKKGTEVGRVIALDPSGRVVGYKTLFTDESVPVGGPLSYFGIEDREAPWVIGAIALLLLIIIILSIRSRFRRRRTKRQSVDDMRSQLVKMRAAGEGMTPMEWSELTGDPKEVPIDKGPTRLSDSEIADLYMPEVTRSSKPIERPKPEPEEDPFKPRRHGRMNSDELEQLMKGELTGKPGKDPDKR